MPVRGRLGVVAAVLPLAAVLGASAPGSARQARPLPPLALFRVGIPVDELSRGPDGNLWFDRNLGGSYSADIGKITPAGKVTIYKPSLIAADGFPGRLAAGPDGGVWFPLLALGRHAGVGRISTNGTGLKTFRVPHLCVYCNVDAIVAGPDRKLWAGDRFDAVHRIAPTGRVELTVDLRKLKLPPAQVNAIVAGPDHRIWFSASNWIGAIVPTSGAVSGYTTPSPHPDITDLIAGPDGNLWFTEHEPTANRIGRITTSGKVTEFSKGLPPRGGPLRLAVGPDRNIWFTEADVHEIGRVTPNGSITMYDVPASLNTSAAGIVLGADRNLWLTFPGAGKIGRLKLPG